MFAPKDPNESLRPHDRTPETAPATPTSPDILPIIFGWDLGDYALARLIHESTGVRPRLYSQIHRGFIDDSKILDLAITEPRAITNREKFAELLLALGEEFPTERVVPLVNTDEDVQLLGELRHRLPGSWIFPYAPAEAIAIADSKTRLSAIATDLGLATPRQNRISTDSPDAAAATLSQLTFPIVLKPDERSQLTVFFTRGMAKVLPCDTLAQADAHIRDWHDAGINASLTAQELIPGDDTTQWVVNGYINRRGEVSAIGSGRVLLGNHEPSLLGNAGIIHVVPNDQLMDDGARLATAVGLRGFFSLDVKVDPRTGTAYWLDLNPRIGRNHYYLKAGGVDVWQAFLQDISGEDDVADQRLSREALYHVLPLRMLNRDYIRDPELLRHVKSLKRSAIDPLRYRADRHPRRALFRRLNAENMRRKTRAHYPKATDSGF
ncbi:carboxylate--amine ligase [Trueperella pecoris]|uniref:ATP-grasp domain-containing protein n=1 Tax=Trueperella pecoris TaxID=2733571 RepID=A0A7M1QVR9_9ACTO|nr:ATP-grasp domain-containing protein [Trueperella pecoris]QOQ39467.1 ATP-grasp domain-containing protein [Trueperella pecoris]QOR45911.1 ATP-grasp domain-containing protein [Trueperella pecoris]